MRAMRATIFLLVILVGTLGSAYSQSATNKSIISGVKFSIRSNGKTKGQGNRTVVLTIRNNGKSQVVVKELNQDNEKNYSVEVRNSKGQLLALSPDGKRLTERSTVEISVIFARIAPGEEITRTIDLSKLYSFEKNETYKVTITKSVYFAASKSYHTLQSNALKIQ